MRSKKMNTMNIEGYGKVHTDHAKATGGNIEVFIPVCMSSKLFSLANKKVADFLQKYPDLTEKDINCEVQVICHFGSYARLDEEFSYYVEFCIWKEVEDENEDDYAEFYDGVPFEFEPESEKKIRRIIWKALEKRFLGK